MTVNQTTVLVLLNDAGEASIPLEVAAAIDEPDISIEVCAFFEPDDATFGLDIHSLGASSQLDPRPYKRFLHLVDRLDPDIVHIHPNATGSVIRMLLAKSDVQLISTEHNSHAHFGRVKRIINGLTNSLNKVVVANSETTKQSFYLWEQLLLSTTGTKVTVVHNGVDIEELDEGRKTGNSPDLPDGFIIGTAARMVPQKNQAALIRAAAPVIHHYDNTHLVFVGEGELKKELKELSEEYGIGENTHFLGYLPKRRDVYAVMDEMDIFAFPSIYEGFGVAVAEAMAIGVPVVANDIEVLQEVLDKAGVFVDVENQNEFTEAIKKLKNHENHRQKLADRGIEQVRSRFSLERTVEKYVNLYRSVQSDGRGIS